MDRSIWIFGNPDRSSEGFESPSDLEMYLAGGIFAKEQGRYRYTQARNADVIVLSRDGKLFGHLEIDDRVRPNDFDREHYSKVKWTYLVRTSNLYPNPVPISTLGKISIHRGAQISEEQFAAVLSFAGEPLVKLRDEIPDSVLAQEWALRTVRQRLRQSEFRKILFGVYGGKCAVTGCDADDVLEAAHIVPFCKRGPHHASNGLLLRADIHCLFDRNALAIEPNTREIRLAPHLTKSSYLDLHNRQLRKPVASDATPNLDALTQRWQAFQAKYGDRI